MSTPYRLTIADLVGTPDDGNRYELIDGELYVTTQPDWRHQRTCDQFTRRLMNWDDETQGGVTLGEPGVIFAPDQAVAPDVLWISRDRVGRVLGESPDGRLYNAPDLVVEVLSPGKDNEDRDRVRKLSLYSRYGVREYWIADWRERTIRVYRHQEAALQLIATLTADDTLTSPLLPGFAVTLRDLFRMPA